MSIYLHLFPHLVLQKAQNFEQIQTLASILISHNLNSIIHLFQIITLILQFKQGGYQLSYNKQMGIFKETQDNQLCSKRATFHTATKKKLKYINDDSNTIRSKNNKNQIQLYRKSVLSKFKQIDVQASPNQVPQQLATIYILCKNSINNDKIYSFFEEFEIVQILGKLIHHLNIMQIRAQKQTHLKILDILINVFQYNKKLTLRSELLSALLWSAMNDDKQICERGFLGIQMLSRFNSSAQQRLYQLIKPQHLKILGDYSPKQGSEYFIKLLEFLNFDYFTQRLEPIDEGRFNQIILIVKRCINQSSQNVKIHDLMSSLLINLTKSIAKLDKFLYFKFEGVYFATHFLVQNQYFLNSENETSQNLMSVFEFIWKSGVGNQLQCIDPKSDIKMAKNATYHKALAVQRSAWNLLSIIISKNAYLFKQFSLDWQPFFTSIYLKHQDQEQYEDSGFRNISNSACFLTYVFQLVRAEYSSYYLNKSRVMEWILQYLPHADEIVVYQTLKRLVELFQNKSNIDIFMSLSGCSALNNVLINHKSSKILDVVSRIEQIINENTLVEIDGVLYFQEEVQKQTMYHI